MEIGMMYPEGLIPEDSLAAVADDLRTHGVEFHAKGMPPEPQMSVEELIAPVMLCLSSDAGQSFLVGLTASGSYDLLKRNILCIWRLLTGKFLTILRGSGATSKRPTNMDLLVSVGGQSSLRIKLESDLPIELQESCLNKALELIGRIETDKMKSEQIAVFDRNHGEWRVYSSSEFITEFLINKGQRIDGEGLGSAGAPPSPSS